MPVTKVSDRQKIDSIDLTTEVTGLLPVANGGTGVGTLTGLIKGNGTSALSAASAGTDYVTPSGAETLASKTITAPVIDYIKDSTNIKPAIAFSSSASAVTYVQVEARDDGDMPTWKTLGSAADVGFRFEPKGAGVLETYNSSGSTCTLHANGAAANMNRNLTTKGTGTVQANGVDLTTVANAAGMLMPVRVYVTGAETFTVASGTVTQIAGTTIQGVSPAVGDRILITSAPASTGVGGNFGHTNQPGNGVYIVTNNTTNLTVARTTDMSGTVNPIGRKVFSMTGASWLGASEFTVSSPTSGTFTWGTTAMTWAPTGGVAPTFNGLITAGSGMAVNNNIYPLSTNANDLGTSGNQFRDLWLSRTPTFSAGIPAVNLPNGITNVNTSTQSQTVVSGTAYYIAGSTLSLPATLRGGMVVGTVFRWTIAMAKTAAGTGIFEIILYRGTAGTTADTADVAQTIGTQTAVVDNMTIDIDMVVTTTGATGAYYWSIIPTSKAASATGFGVPVGPTGQFSGTKSSVAMNTASLKFGIGFRATTGTPTVTVPLVRATTQNIS